MKTSVELPIEVWRAAKIRALDERKTFQEIVAKALRAYLGSADRGRQQ